MAFGSWFKNIINGAKNVIGKALPVLKKGAEIVSKVAPVLGGAIGGVAGNVINKIGSFADWTKGPGNYAGKFAGTAGGPYNAVGNKSLGVNGAGIRPEGLGTSSLRQTNNSWSQPISGPVSNPGRFDIPLLK